MSEKLFDVTVEKKAETEKAFLLTDGSREAWFPKSQCELETIAGRYYVLTAPINLLKEKEFI